MKFEQKRGYSNLLISTSWLARFIFIARPGLAEDRVPANYTFMEILSHFKVSYLEETFAMIEKFSSDPWTGSFWHSPQDTRDSSG